MRSVLLSLVLTALATPALASDGVLEINQTCAVETGCFPGDTAAYPVTITTPGSYRLTGNLTVPDGETTAIRVETALVTIDLGGFALTGPTDCDFVQQTCQNTGQGVGVDANLFGVESVTVRNGSVSGMGSVGVLLGSGGRIESISARSNGSVGLQVSNGVIRDSVARENGSSGIQAAYAVVVNSSASNNLGDGIVGGFGVQVVDSNASLNRGFGLDLPTTAGLGRVGSYKGCSMQGNNGGDANPQVDGGVQIGSNVCGQALCP